MSPSTKSKECKRDLGVRQSKKDHQWYFGMKAHIGVAEQSGLVLSVIGRWTASSTSTKRKCNCTVTKPMRSPTPVSGLQHVALKKYE
jgi:hypothetical protein